MQAAKALSVGRPASIAFFALAIFFASQTVRAQQAAGPIERARLFQKTPAITNSAVTADGMAIASSEPSGDDSFGDQVILKSQPRARPFVITGDASVFYTDNVALTRNDKTGDSFFVAHAGGSWTPRLTPTLEAQIAASVSAFRYSDTSELDFTNLGIGAGLLWAPQHSAGVSFFARYDFIELLSRHGNEILQDHEFTVGAQQVVAFGRSHSLIFGATGMAGIANPYAAQRDQAGVFVGYRAQLARALDLEVFYRGAVHFYNDSGRVDGNQVVSTSLRYRFNAALEANAFFSYGNNRSEKSVFDYDVVTGGGGVALTLRF